MLLIKSRDEMGLMCEGVLYVIVYLFGLTRSSVPRSWPCYGSRIFGNARQ
jgi:hypothetical protein